MTQKNTDKSKMVSLNNQLAKIANELGKIEGCHEDAKGIWGSVFKLSTTINSIIEEAAEEIIEEAAEEDDDDDDFVNYGDMPK